MIDWSALEHAYGAADDTPGLIARLREGDWPEAVEDLFSSILHQGSVYPATLAALPLLAGVALDRDAPGRLGALQLLCSYGDAIAAGSSRNPAYLPPGTDLEAFDAQARAGLAHVARTLLPSITDPDPEIRVAVYECSCYWQDSGPEVAGALRGAFAGENDLAARVALMEPLARHQLLTAPDLDALVAREQDEVLFAAAWSAVACGLGLAGARQHLVRLWPTCAAAYPGQGEAHSLHLLIENAGSAALPVLRDLAQGPVSALTTEAVAEAWGLLAAISRAAAEPAAEALIGLLEPAVANGAPATVAVLEALLTVRPAAGPWGPAIAGAVVGVLDQEPTDRLVLATAAVLLFALEEPLWAVPALTVVDEPGELNVAVGDGGNRADLLTALVGYPGPRRRPVSWASEELIAVAERVFAVHPDRAGPWAYVLGGLTPSIDLAGLLLRAASRGGPDPRVLRALATVAAGDRRVFPPDARTAVGNLVAGDPAGEVWLVTTRALLGAEPDPGAAFSRIWQLAENVPGRDDLIRIWALMPTPQLETACRELLAGGVANSLFDRHLQLAAASHLLDGGGSDDGSDDDRARAVWPTVRTMADLADQPLRETVAVGDRVAQTDDTLLPDWLELLHDLAGPGRTDWFGPHHEATALAVESLLRFGALTADQALDRALAAQAAAVRVHHAGRVTPVLARVLRQALEQDPGLRPRAVEALAPLLESDRRTLSSSRRGITEDTELARLLREALA
ncbi:hypothetical protein KIH74_18035 [Kineosporia sp. J2-2]|uniref:HEAT repeat protein n=1 Tax=Kineosporia corallincola TaxID=2835133 RepID=A0ABS5TLC5_9ACTN|nr:hypothetical protein [Kineosporia corallincola]MBT0770848.1 hypothetical protein [Kineosporia corallincola]